MVNFNKKELDVFNVFLNRVNTHASTHIPFTKCFDIEEYLSEKLTYTEINNLHEKIQSEIRRVHNG